MAHDTIPSPTPGAPRITLVSFDYLHGEAPTADLTVDVRRWLRDPAAALAILNLDGRDPRVQQVVCHTNGAVQAIRHITRFAPDYPADRDCLVAIGCAGGRHRSVALIALAAGALLMFGHPVHVEHRDVHRPRVLHAPALPPTTTRPPGSPCP